MEKFFCANLWLDDFVFLKSLVLRVSIYEVLSILIEYQSLQSMKCLAQNGEIVPTKAKLVVPDISHSRIDFVSLHIKGETKHTCLSTRVCGGLQFVISWAGLQ